MAFLDARRQFEHIPEANQDAYTATHRNARVLARIHARECRVWKSRIIEKLKADRSEAIWSKLYVLQWGAELKVVTRYKFDYLPLVNRAEELTDAVWAEIGPDLERHLLRVREEEAALKEQNLLILARKRIKGTRSCVPPMNENSDRGSIPVNHLCIQLLLLLQLLPPLRRCRLASSTRWSLRATFTAPSTPPSHAARAEIPGAWTVVRVRESVNSEWHTAHRAAPPEPDSVHHPRQFARIFNSLPSRAPRIPAPRRFQGFFP
ncbi:hypothetical protein FB451DRAFT_1399587 [Mycena latifolia]|nr:hypothetical protein FB451DRAFT_1399587 [Mycena latifolia]